MSNEINVTCEDGVKRHDEPFASMGDARQWAEWGHCCTRSHTFTERVRPPFAGAWDVPAGRLAVWGARFIIHQDGGVDRVWDRQGCVEGYDDAQWRLLADWLDGRSPERSYVGAMSMAEDALSKMLRDRTLSTREDREVVLYEDDHAVIRANPRASAGYCYVVAYMKGDA